MARPGRTSLHVGEQDVADLLDAVNDRARWLEERRGTWPEPLERQLPRMYVLRRRLTAAADRLRADRGGRGEAAS